MTNATQKIRDFYAAPGPMTSAGKYESQLKNLPDDIGELARIVQGLIVHQFVAEPFYGDAAMGCLGSAATTGRTTERCSGRFL
jgi:hypothetical protein